MIDMMDNMFWLALLGVTGLLYGLNWLVDRRKRTVYRISQESLTVSKQILLKVLPLVEDGGEDSLDIEALPISKENVKSAVKILAYFYLKGGLQDDFMRIKNCFLALSRFQNQEKEPKTIARRMAREKRRLTREFNGYIARSPYCETDHCETETESVLGETDKEIEE